MAHMIQSINGIDPLLEPMKMNIVRSDLYSDSSERTAETGDMLLYPIRYGLYSIELEFLGTAEQVAHIESCIAGSDYPVTFLDLESYVTRYMYPSDRNREPVGTVNDRKYRLSFSLIETREN